MSSLTLTQTATSVSAQGDTLESMIFNDDDKGAEWDVAEIPDDLIDIAKEWRNNLVEKCAEQDEEMMEKFFSEGDLSEDEIWNILRKATCARDVVPVFCGSAFKNKGVQQLLDGVPRSATDGDPILSVVRSTAEGMLQEQ